MKDFKKLLIKPSRNIASGLRQMVEVGEKILFITDSNGTLLGTVTDGDIRRWLLKNNKLTENLELVMNKKPVFIKKGTSIENTRNLMLSKKIEYVPEVNDKMQIISVISWVDLFARKEEKAKSFNIPVVIMAGGKGTRLSPFTKILPKPLIPIGERPILEIIIDNFAEYGCTNFYLSVNYKANMIKSYFNEIEHRYKIHYIEEEKPLGTLGSLYFLKDKIKTTFFLSNCDIIVKGDYCHILETHKNNKNIATITASIKHYTIPYGICEIDEEGNLKNLKEKPEYEFLANTGMYIFEPDIFKFIDGTYCNATDILKKFMNKKEKIGTYPVPEDCWLDIGQLEELEDTIKKFGVK